MKPSIHIVVFDFLPYHPSLGGVARVYHLAKVLNDRQYPVKVLSAMGKFSGYHGLDKHFIQDRTSYVKSPINSNKKKVSDRVANSYLASLFARLAKNMLIPDFSMLSLPYFWRELKNSISPGDVVIISCPKHGLALLTIFIKFIFGRRVNVILDYRDSWNSQPIFDLDFFLSRFISRFLERKVLSKIDYLTFVSPKVPALLDRVLGYSPVSSKLIRNGYDANFIVPFNARVFDKKKIKFIYFGSGSDSLESYRNLGYLIEAFKNYTDFTLDFFGDIIFSNYNLNDYKNINYRGSITNAELSRISKDYSFSIILHTDSRSAEEVIPGKLYDSIGLNIPIINISPENAAVSDMVKEYHVGLNVSPTVADIISFLSNPSIIELTFNDAMSSYQNLDTSIFSRQVALEGFVEVIDELKNKI